IQQLRAWKLLLPLSLVQAGLLFFHIGRESLWLDEVVNLPASRGTWLQSWEYFTQVPEQHPLYYLLLRAWLHLGSSELALRSLSALFALATVWATFFLARELFDDLVAINASALLALSPFLIYYGQEARMYSLLGLLTTVSSYLLLRVIATERLGLLVGYLFVTVLGAYTHPFFMLVVAAHLGTLLSRRRSGSLLRRLAAVYAAVALLYAPWAMLIAFHGAGSRSWRGSEHVIFGIPHMLLRFSLGYSELPPNYQWRTSIPALLAQNAGVLAISVVTFGALAFVGIREALRHDREGRLALWGFAIPPLLALLGSPVVNLVSERYLIVSFPFYLILLALGMVALVRAESTRRFVGPVLVAAYVLVVVHALHRYYFDPDFGKEEWSAVADHLRAQAGPRDVIVVHQWYATAPLLYYYHKPPGQRVFGWGDVRSDDLRASDRLWLVLRDPDNAVEQVVALNESHRVLSDRLFRKQSGIRVLLLVRRGASSNRSGTPASRTRAASL
ncbi:MAG: glycosyltransferase family 39 protein, partial [Gammaproteobacteria bacterium]